MEQFWGYIHEKGLDDHVGGQSKTPMDWLAADLVVHYLERFQTPGTNTWTGGNYDPRTCNNFAQALLQVH